MLYVYVIITEYYTINLRYNLSAEIAKNITAYWILISSMMQYTEESKGRELDKVKQCLKIWIQRT